MGILAGVGLTLLILRTGNTADRSSLQGRPPAVQPKVKAAKCDSASGHATFPIKTIAPAASNHNGLENGRGSNSSGKDAVSFETVEPPGSEEEKTKLLDLLFRGEKSQRWDAESRLGVALDRSPNGDQAIQAAFETALRSEPEVAIRRSILWHFWLSADQSFDLFLGSVMEEDSEWFQREVLKWADQMAPKVIPDDYTIWFRSVERNKQFGEAQIAELLTIRQRQVADALANMKYSSEELRQQADGVRKRLLRRGG
jgi:hypothetical protein